MPSDASVIDPAGNLIGLLFVKRGYFDEVEVFTYEDTWEFAGLPDPRALKLSYWSRPDGMGQLLNP
jgi:hypothetical protein